MPTILHPPAGFIEQFNAQALLIYTGKTRLARGLLQSVLRRWAAQLPEILDTTDGLLRNANAARAAIEAGADLGRVARSPPAVGSPPPAVASLVPPPAGDWTALGAAVSTYWEQKKRMAGPGCEPAPVTTLLRCLAPFAVGCALAGAGGGGFLLVLARTPADADAIREAMAAARSANDRASDDCLAWTVHTATVDMEGLRIGQLPSAW